MTLHENVFFPLLPCLDGQLQVEVLPLVNELLCIHSHLLHEISEQPTEEEGKEGACQVQPLVAVVVTVVQFTTTECSKKEPVDHVAQEVGLPGLAEVRNSNMRKHLLLKNFVCVSGKKGRWDWGGLFCLGTKMGSLYPLLFGDAWPGTSGANKVKSHILLLDDKGLIKGWLDHLHQLRVIKVVNNVLEDVPVGHKAQCTEDDHNGDLLLNVGQDSHNALADGRLLNVGTSTGKHVYPQRRSWSVKKMAFKKNKLIFQSKNTAHLDECSRHDLISVLKAYLLSFIEKT